MDADPTNGLLGVPGYMEAVARERLVRDVAFLPVTESIGSFEVLPMSLRHFIMLRTINSPLLSHGIPNEKELSDFLWVLSPDWKQDAAVRDEWMKRCACFVPPPLPRVRMPRLMRRWEKAVTDASVCMADLTEQAWVYVAEALQDRPQIKGFTGFMAEFYSDSAALCDVLMKEYHGLNLEACLSMRMKCLFQFLKRIEERSPRPRPLFNPSDRITMDYYSRLNSEHKEN